VGSSGAGPQQGRERLCVINIPENVLGLKKWRQGRYRNHSLHGFRVTSGAQNQGLEGSQGKECVMFSRGLFNEPLNGGSGLSAMVTSVVSRRVRDGEILWIDDF
jgi:hypothetical protein